MSYITQAERHGTPPMSRATSLGLTPRDYEGGHVHAVRRLRTRLRHGGASSSPSGSSSVEPHNVVAKLSGIGCSSKTPTYFMQRWRTASTPCTAACRRSRRVRNAANKDG